MGDNGPGNWTPERVEILKGLWKDGMSAPEIAKQLGGITRNAVIGKAHRLSLPGRAARAPKRIVYKTPRPAAEPEPAPSLDHPWRPGSTGKTKLHPAGNRVYLVSEDRPLPEREEMPGTCTMLDLGAHMCKWPIGDPRADDFSFCGRRSEESGPYCDDHHAVAYQPPRDPSGPRTEAQKLGDLKRRATQMRKAVMRAAAA